MKTKKMRVQIFRNPEEIILLAGKVYAKHLEMGDKSPLANMEDFNWSDQGPKAVNALELHTRAEALKAQMEKCYRERDLFVAGLDEAVKGSRDVLTGVYRQNMKRMGDWGFSVDDTPKVKKETKKVSE